ncbi:hypothetical protein BS17DRAFT_705593, partial [Gyrodon lividus]
ILVNPTSRKAKWRAVDWCIKLNNLFMKVSNGGKGSNHTVERIIPESLLIQVYRNIQVMIQQTFDYTHHTTNHTDPTMKRTYEKLLKKLALDSPHTPTTGRKT